MLAKINVRLIEQRLCRPRPRGGTVSAASQRHESGVLCDGKIIAHVVCGWCVLSVVAF